MSMSTTRKRLAIFDLDGTLFDSMSVWEDVDRVFLARRGFALPSDYAEIIGPMGFPRAAAYTKERFSLSESEEEIMAEWKALSVSAYEEAVPLKHGAYAYLSSLARRGIPIAAATASRAEYYLPAMKRLGIFDMFASITKISEVTRGKGHPDIYLRAMEKTSPALVPGECVVFEDILPGVHGAQSGGFYTVAVHDDRAASADMIRAIADRYIYSFEELFISDVF